jgi:DNA-binding PadR family transcriptional regulator
LVASGGRDPREELPLTPALFHVLVALADGDKHGYAIIKEVRARTGGKVELSTGTLYGILKRLLSGGLIAESPRRPPAPQDDERRRYYRLTDFGRAVAVAEAERLTEMLASARAKRLLKRPV